MTVTVHEAGADSPQAEDPQSVTDSTGRHIELRKPSILQQYNVLLAVGAEAAANQAYMSVVTPLLYVRAIDGDPIAFPTTKRQLDALIQRLDEPGVAAVMQWFEGELQRAAASGASAKN